MNALPEPFFSWTSRRIDLTAAEDVRPLLPEIDESLRCGTREARLLAIRDSESETEYVALLVGDIAGRNDVTVREVEEELLLVDAGRPSAEPESLVGVAPEQTYGLSGAGHVDRAVFEDGPLRSLIIRSGARSVVVDWYHGSHPSSASTGRDATTGPSADGGCIDESYRVSGQDEPAPTRTAARWLRRLLFALRFGSPWSSFDERSRGGPILV